MTQNKLINFEITAPAVRAQVTRIVASEAFVRSRRMQRFLEFIVEETLAGRADELGEYGIGIAVFDRGQDFEPALDPIVRNDARRLRAKLHEYYRGCSPGSAQVLIDIPKGGYVPVFRCAAESEVPSSTRRVAVLPFEVLSAAPESAKYGRALCMSLTAKLTNLDGVEAVAHGFLDEVQMCDAATELRLSHVIHGSVVRSSSRCQVIINLVHIADGTQLWAREYECESSEMLEFQSEIAGSALHEMAARLGVRRPQPIQLAVAA